MPCALSSKAQITDYRLKCSLTIFTCSSLPNIDAVVAHHFRWGNKRDMLHETSCQLFSEHTVDDTLKPASSHYTTNAINKQTLL